MANITRHLRPDQNKFQKIFEKLCQTHSAWQTWSDFVEISAISISNACEIRESVRQEREERYLNTISRYDDTDRNFFPELFAILVEALEKNPEQDFLGEMFMALELGSHWKGQFFTPYNLCKAMAMLTVPSVPEKLKEKEWVGLNDPACGAGATLIGARNALKDMDIGPSQAFFVGQDLDRTAGMMCYIQLSLLGCAGYVVIADTLCNPVAGPMLWPNLTEHQEAWFMPLNFMEPAWVLRLSRTWRGMETDEEPICNEKATATPPAEDNYHEIATATQAVAEIATTTPKEPEPLPKKQRKGKSAAKKAAGAEPELTMLDTESGQLTLF